MEFSGETSFSYAGDDVEVELERGNVDSFEDRELLTQSGSGVIVPALDEEIESDEYIQINVLAYN